MGIVHRDLKPENIFLCKQGTLTDYPKVLDFGLAKVTEQQMRPGSIILTQEGMVFGTPEFMSPEQAQGRTLDARSDIYSLAVILYEVLTGKLPFSARTPMEYIQKHVMEPPILLNQRVPERQFAPGLEAVLAKALQKKPEDRYQSAADFAEALRSFGSSVDAPQYHSSNPRIQTPSPAAAQAMMMNPTPTMPTTPTTKRPGAGLLIGVAAACLIAGVLIAIVAMQLFLR